MYLCAILCILCVYVCMLECVHVCLSLFARVCVCVGENQTAFLKGYMDYSWVVSFHLWMKTKPFCGGVILMEGIILCLEWLVTASFSSTSLYSLHLPRLYLATLCL